MLGLFGGGLEQSSPLDTLCRDQGQASAVGIQVDEREVGTQSLMFLGQTAVPDLEAEDTLQDVESMLDPGLIRQL